MKISTKTLLVLSLFIFIGVISCSQGTGFTGEYGYYLGRLPVIDKNTNTKWYVLKWNKGTQEGKNQNNSLSDEKTNNLYALRNEEWSEAINDPEKRGQSEEEEWSGSSLVAENLEEAKKAVWNVSAGGTGFFISERLLVTNMHVVTNIQPEGNISEVYLRRKDSKRIIEVNRLLALSVYPDLALLETKSSAPFHLGIKESSIRLDEIFFILGFPASRNGHLTTMESIGPIVNERRAFVPTNFYDHPGGASGSPVLDAGAYVVGVAFAAPKENWSSIMFVTRNELETFLDEADAFFIENESYPCEKIEFEECLSQARENILDEASGTNNFKAQHELGYAYANGEAGFEKDKEESNYWFKTSNDNWKQYIKNSAEEQIEI